MINHYWYDMVMGGVVVIGGGAAGRPVTKVNDLIDKNIFF